MAYNLSKQCVWSPGGVAALAPLAAGVELRGTRRAASAVAGCGRLWLVAEGNHQRVSKPGGSACFFY